MRTSHIDTTADHAAEWPSRATNGRCNGDSVSTTPLPERPGRPNGTAAPEDDGYPAGVCPVVLPIKGDARHVPLPEATVDLVTTSPPYWNKRDYGVDGQIGQESTAEEFVTAIVECLAEWRRVLRPTGSVFLNIGDTYHKRSLAGIPARVEAAAGDDRWIIRNRIIWAKEGGMPEPARNRLANRHEYVLHLVPRSSYYYDLHGYAEELGNGANPGDVWAINPGRHMGDHLAPFPPEIVRRAILLACPRSVCTDCGTPRKREVRRTTQLDPARPQARRAMELAKQHNLTEAHIAAIQATGVSDAGKALKTQNGTGRNSATVRALAAEAKDALGGYFREFTFARRVTGGWSKCGCGAPFQPGVVLDPFMGTGTTLTTAFGMGRSAVGVDLSPAMAERRAAFAPLKVTPSQNGQAAGSL
jgi:DNA modification methylase